MKSRAMFLAALVVVTATGCASTGGVQDSIRDARRNAAATTVAVDRQSVAVSPNNIPVYVDRESIREWWPPNSGGRRSDDQNAVDHMFAVARELVNQTRGLRVYIPSQLPKETAPQEDRRGQRRSLAFFGTSDADRRRTTVMPSYDDIQIADGRVPFWFGVVASEAIRRNDTRYRRRDLRDGGSAWATVTVELRAPADGGWVVVASGTGERGWRRFIVAPIRVWGLPYDAVYEASGEAIMSAYADMMESLDLAPWAEVWRNH